MIGNMSSKGMRIVSQKTTKVTAIGHINMIIIDKIKIIMAIEETKKPAKSIKAFSKKNGIAKNVKK